MEGAQRGRESEREREREREKHRLAGATHVCMGGRLRGRFEAQLGVRFDC